MAKKKKGQLLQYCGLKVILSMKHGNIYIYFNAVFADFIAPTL